MGGVKNRRCVRCASLVHIRCRRCPRCGSSRMRSVTNQRACREDGLRTIRTQSNGVLVSLEDFPFVKELKRKEIGTDFSWLENRRKKAADIDAVKAKVCKYTDLTAVEEVMFRMLGSGFTSMEAMIGVSILVKEREPASCMFEAIREAVGLPSRNVICFNRASGVNTRNFVKAASEEIEVFESRVNGVWRTSLSIYFREGENLFESGAIAFENEHCWALIPRTYTIRHRQRSAIVFPENVAITHKKRYAIFKCIENHEEVMGRDIRIDPKMSIHLHEKGITVTVKEKRCKAEKLCSVVQSLLNYQQNGTVDWEGLLSTKVEKRFQCLSDIPSSGYAEYPSNVRMELHWYLVMAALQGTPMHKKSKYSTLLDVLGGSNEADGIEVNYPMCMDMKQRLGISVWKELGTNQTYTQMPDGVTLFKNVLHNDVYLVHVTDNQAMVSAEMEEVHGNLKIGFRVKPLDVSPFRLKERDHHHDASNSTISSFAPRIVRH